MGLGRHLIYLALPAAALLIAGVSTAAARVPRDSSYRALLPSPGWPIAPVDEQHPIRGGFFDPRPGRGELVYHNGIDISIRDDLPEPGHPPYRSHRVYALESGEVAMAEDTGRRICSGRHVRVGRFGYGHVDPIGTVEQGASVRAGEAIGWTCKGQWHMHLSEFRWEGGRQLWINPLRPGGRLRPYLDDLAPVVHELGFYEPVEAQWSVVNGAVQAQAIGAQLSADRLAGIVDARAQVGDPQSFTGWLSAFEFRYLAAELAPSRIDATVRHAGGSLVWSRTALQADVLPAALPYGTPYAPGTTQNLPVAQCFRVDQERCAGRYWFHVGAASNSLFWDTRTVANGDYELCVTATDAVGNASSSCTRFTVAN